MRDVAVFVGSLRNDPIDRKAANESIRKFLQGLVQVFENRNSATSGHRHLPGASQPQALHPMEPIRTKAGVIATYPAAACLLLQWLELQWRAAGQRWNEQRR